MNWSDQFVELDKSTHDRDSFDCGETELNELIQKFAAKHMHAGISRTMVLPATTALPDNKNPICAFYTIAPSSIRRESLPEMLAKNYHVIRSLYFYWHNWLCTNVIRAVV